MVKVWLLAACVGVVGACEVRDGGFQEIDLNDSIEDRVEDGASEATGASDVPIDFADVAGFDWSEMWVFTPYTPEAEIAAALGVAVEKLASEVRSISTDDHANVLVFRVGDDAFKFSVIRRSLVDFRESFRIGPDGSRLRIRRKTTPVGSRRVIGR